MFSTKPVTETPAEKKEDTDDLSKSNKYRNIIQLSSSEINEANVNNLDKLLEKEKQHNKTESWNKLNKTVKLQKLHQFAERYGKENALPVKEVKVLKQFFIDCLEKDKIQKAKDVNYDKDTHEILSIPALFFNSLSRNFTLRNMDTKRVSTLKSLTPKRTTPSQTDENVSEVASSL